MKILFCINSLVKGGAERVISNLANYFANKDEVAIMTLTNFDVEYELKSNINVIKLDKKCKNPYKINNKFIRIVLKIPKFLNRSFRMKKEIIKLNPDIIVSFLPETSFLVLFNKRKTDKVIVSVRNDPKIEYKSKIYNFLMKKLYPKANAFIFQTSDAKRYFKNILSVKSEIIPNSINPYFIGDKYEGKRQDKIVAVGRLTNQKNFELLIKAFSEINKRFPQYKLIIYGEGEKRLELENLIKELNLEKYVELPGLCNDIKEKIYDAKVFVLSSLYEGMPNALLEAMALGIPVIATDCPCGGPKELIGTNNEKGILVEVDNCKQLVDAIEKVLTDESLQKKLSENAYTITDTMNPDIINCKWERFIKDI